MGIGMSNCTVDGQWGTDSDSHHHESDLINLTVTKHTTKVILDYRIKNREHRHYATNRDQNLGTRK